MILLQRLEPIFFNVPDIEYLINRIMKSNQYEIEQFLCMNNSAKRDERKYKIIISNFIRNAKYISRIELLLLEHQIFLKQVEDYSYDECHKILVLLSNIVFCQCGTGQVFYLFENLEDGINDSIEFMKWTKEKKNNDNDIKNYEEMISVYDSTKEYLKYFK